MKNHHAQQFTDRIINSLNLKSFYNDDGDTLINRNINYNHHHHHHH